ncbi:uncharacterized protein LOC111874329 isoform X2 [Cryptotermes secundus]|uniref:uncharacterized protein LOC111874329 isoform X2 n=1 Tax=Cryptotermes secundus TaxID=105785 RepID=UPI000CD7DAFF|nr:uncharacterized protein LOC111874329 isoform X2 [Cryptotermes secundus]XP_023725510.1 uncharacterized protein LOC111874329 isoform X2 [Cryptotermes secundus]XP_023725515.1 uncharacterized protein LOC111874329 isoform X2 [Cryptotermes secundus]
MKFDSVYPTEKRKSLCGENHVCWPSDAAVEESVGLRCPAPISRLRVEKIEGGLMVAGVVVAANCQVALPAFGFLFMLVGAVLTAASYRGPGRDEGPDHYAARVAFTGNSRVLGPACIVVGVVMLAAGVGLCLLTRRARRRERRVGFHCPLHGDFYPLSPVTGSRSIGLSGTPVSQWALCWRRGGNAKPGTFGGPPQCPHSTLSSTRSSVSSTPASPCPTPLPFLVTSGSVSSGMVPSVGTNLSPDQTFGSIRSLSVSREVASFPLSRTPTPPPTMDSKMTSPTLGTMDESSSVTSATARNDLPPVVVPLTPPEFPSPRPEITVVAPVIIPQSPPAPPTMRSPRTEVQDTIRATALVITRGPRKSVSIVLPDEENG